MRGGGGALPVVGAALSTAEDAAGVGSGGRADKATVAAPEALGPGAYGGAGGCEMPPHGKAWREVDAPLREGERASVECDRGALTRWGPRKEGPVRTRKECDRVEGTHLWRPQRKEYVATSDLRVARSADAWKEIGRARGTHHRRHRGRNTPGHGKTVNKRGALTVERPQKEGHVGVQKKVIGLPQSKGLVHVCGWVRTGVRTVVWGVFTSSRATVPTKPSLNP